jgi:hypothetical protein
MAQFSPDFGAQKPTSTLAAGGELRAEPRSLSAAATRPSAADNRTSVGTSELHRLSVGGDGRLFWDGKPVVVRRRLLLTFWQKVGLIWIGVSALLIGLSAAVHGTIAAHEWMCGAKWMSGSCPGAAPSAPPAPPRPQLPEIPT